MAATQGDNRACLKNQGRYPGTEGACGCALKAVETAKTQSATAIIYQDQAQCPGVLGMYFRSLAAAVKALGLGYLLAATAKMSIGSILHGQGKFPAAIQMYG